MICSPLKATTSTFTSDHYTNVDVYVPQEALTTYQRNNRWKSFMKLQGFNYTGIENIKTESGNDVYYDLRGNRLSAPKHGLNIINGKKYVVK